MRSIRGMESTSYERPREKLRQYGVTSLTNHELVQLIIGSGTAKMPVAKMARKVSGLLHSGGTDLTYDTLVGIDGVGDATICRILAALDLGRRIALSAPLESDSSGQQQSRSRKGAITFCTLDGGGKVMQTYTEPSRKMIHTPLARYMCSKVMADNAHGLMVTIFESRKETEPPLKVAAFLAELKDITQRLGIKLHTVDYMSQSSRQRLYEASL